MAAPKVTQSLLPRGEYMTSQLLVYMTLVTREIGGSARGDNILHFIEHLTNWTTHRSFNVPDICPAHNGVCELLFDVIVTCVTVRPSRDCDLDKFSQTQSGAWCLSREARHIVTILTAFPLNNCIPFKAP